jgi:manganese/zinc/iron transport system ATP- binding protein
MTLMQLFQTSATPRGHDHDLSSPLSIHDLTVAYDRKPVLWDVDLDVPAGKLVGVVGPNGAGKSTLIKAVLQLVPTLAGEVRVFGQPYRQQRARVGYVPQRESVDWDFPISAVDVVAMGLYGKIGWLRPVRAAHRKRALEALDRVGLADFAQRQISQLSGGQQQRVFLARALVQDADLYLMDEPFAAVDAATESAIVAILKDLRDQGKTALVVHHDLQTVADYFDHVILINGRIVAHGPVESTFTPDLLHTTYGGKLSLLEEVAEKLRDRR